jgi:hypothetical protein
LAPILPAATALAAPLPPPGSGLNPLPMGSAVGNTVGNTVGKAVGKPNGNLTPEGNTLGMPEGRSAGLARAAGSRKPRSKLRNGSFPNGSLPKPPCLLPVGLAAGTTTDGDDTGITTGVIMGVPAANDVAAAARGASVAPEDGSAARGTLVGRNATDAAAPTPEAPVSAPAASVGAEDGAAEATNDVAAADARIEAAAAEAGEEPSKASSPSDASDESDPRQNISKV